MHLHTHEFHKRPVIYSKLHRLMLAHPVADKSDRALDLMVDELPLFQHLMINQHGDLVQFDGSIKLDG